MAIFSLKMKKAARKELSEKFNESFDNITIHGVSNAKKSFPNKIVFFFWLLVILLFVLWLIYAINSNLLEFNKFETILSLDYEAEKSSEFPAVLIRNYNAIISCTFNGIDCPRNNYFNDSGDWFFNQGRSVLKSTMLGSDYGLKLELKSQNPIVVIHDQEHLKPVKRSVSNGMISSMIINRKVHKLLGAPYGQCFESISLSQILNGSDDSNLYPYKINDCILLAHSSVLMKNCNRHDDFMSAASFYYTNRSLFYDMVKKIECRKGVLVEYLILVMFEGKSLIFF